MVVFFIQPVMTQATRENNNNESTLGATKHSDTTHLGVTQLILVHSSVTHVDAIDSSLIYSGLTYQCAAQ